MTPVRTIAVIGLVGLGAWLLSTAPASAGGPGFVAETVDALGASAPAGTGNIGSDCTYNGIFLGGKVKFVDSFADVRIKAVSSFPDLKVKKVSSFADKCGEWQIVDSFADFTVEVVDSFPDVEVAWVDSFPGPG